MMAIEGGKIKKCGGKRDGWGEDGKLGRRDVEKFNRRVLS